VAAPPYTDNRFIVINYFLVFGLASANQARTVHSFAWTDTTKTHFVVEHNFNPNPTLGALQASPHSNVFVPLP